MRGDVGKRMIAGGGEEGIVEMVHPGKRERGRGNRVRTKGEDDGDARHKGLRAAEAALCI